MSLTIGFDGVIIVRKDGEISESLRFVFLRNHDGSCHKIKSKHDFFLTLYYVVKKYKEARTTKYNTR